MRSKIKKTLSGFTLMELLIALFIFSILSAFSFRAVNTISGTSTYFESELEALKKLQQTMLFLRKDLQSNYMSLAGDLTVGKPEHVIFVLSGSKISTGSSLDRIEYSLSEGHLFRKNTANSMTPVQLLNDVSLQLQQGGTQGRSVLINHKTWGVVNVNAYSQPLLVLDANVALSGELGYIKENQPFVDPTIEAIW